MVAKYIVVHVIFLGRLRCEHERLHEATHGLASVGELARHLHDHRIADRRLAVNLADLGATIAEVEGRNLVVDFLQPEQTMLGLPKSAVA